MSRVAVAGEALIDLVTTDGVTFTAHEGGGSLNVAIGTARLGLPTAFVGRISDTTFGRKLATHLRVNGVSDRLVAKASEPTTLAVASLDADGIASYDFYVDGTADWQWHDEDLPEDLQADVLHLGTLGMLIEPGASVFERLAKRVHDDVLITYDPNIRPALASDHEVERVERQVALADVVKASDEDVAWLYPDADLVDVMQRWATLGPALVVVTRGGDGAIALTSDHVVRRNAPQVEVVDTVGAGDSFMAGLLAALDDRELLNAKARGEIASLDEAALAEIIDFAINCAAITCSRAGANPPTREDLGIV